LTYFRVGAGVKPGAPVFGASPLAGTVTARDLFLLDWKAMIVLPV
jgi:hypothetical protein